MPSDEHELETEQHIPHQVAEVLGKLDPDERHRIQAYFASSQISYGPPIHPFGQKMTSTHVGQIIDSQKEETRLEFEDRREARRTTARLVVFGVTALIVVILVLALTNHSEEFGEVMKLLATGAGGFGGGYATAASRSR